MSTATMRTGNPVFQPSVLNAARSAADTSSGTMTLQGTVIRTLILVGVLMATATFTWAQTLVATEAGLAVGNRSAAIGYMIVGFLGGFVMALVTAFVPRISPWTAPVYAALEGLALGGLSAIFEARFPGIVVSSIGLTVGTLVLLLGVYSTGLVRVTEGFKAGVIAATGAVMLVYLVSIILRLFGVGVPFIHDSGPFGIIFSLVVVVIASLNLVLDFDNISENVRYGAPKYMEWYCGFGLLVTLVWLYLEVLRLLAKLRGRD